jgi:hypothetical protein
LVAQVRGEPNGTHDLQAEEETLLFVSSSSGIRIVEYRLAGSLRQNGVE